MARTPTITNDQILKAARDVFLKQGVSATAVDVANRAGISSGSIFKRYPTKEALFFAAMSDALDPIWTPELAAAVGHGDTRADLLLIARRFSDFATELIPRLMLLRSAGQQSGMPMPPRIDNDFAALTAYLGREMALGRIAQSDPSVSAMTMLHTTVGFALASGFEPAAKLFDAQGFLAGFVDMLWSGIKPVV